MQTILNFLLAAALLLSVGIPVSAQIIVPDNLVVRQMATITIDTGKLDTIVVTYRPNSSIVRSEILLPQGGRNTFLWTPQKVGIVRLSSKTSGTRNVSVQFEKASYSGILVMALAAVILFGGAAFSFKTLLEKEEGKEVISRKHPDT
ncbi:MAG: hypothetical protein H6573_32265 [Lewinellaceae bacterium]|nr:hypothetical protein [Phaeodactylibacter sp.]MCB0614839.1 hypothetical protein [Phaeodactylibacter sp.]MCB9352134.1 hypothetical protein [Lewinellaceae bacterium]